MSYGSPKLRDPSSAAWVVAIVLFSATLATFVSWRLPGLNLYARDRLMQARGPISPPDDIVIVAIDEASIARYGRFPWQRSLTTRLLDTIAAGQPKAIAVDILYTERTTQTDDTALADSLKRAGNTVVAAQLIETLDDKGAAAVRWLRPIGEIADSAAGLGHVNVSTEADGAARELSLRKSDDQGQALWSIAVETVRVGEGIRAQTVRQLPTAVVLGSRTIPVTTGDRTLSVAASDVNSRVEILQPDRMLIDYVGPPGSYSTFSFADVIDGRVPSQSFRGKYILIGATAATLGDHVASPFVHTEGAVGEQYGELMPGVEVLANAINTILRSRFYHEPPEWLALLLTTIVAAAVVGLLGVAQGRFETLKQLAVIFGLFATIISLSYLAFVHWMFVPPLVPALLSFAIAAPLALLRRSLSASADLDKRIEELALANELSFLSGGDRKPTDTLRSPATLMANLTRARTVAIYVRDKNEGSYRLLTSHGGESPPRLNESEIQAAGSLRQSLRDWSIEAAGLPEVVEGTWATDSSQRQNSGNSDLTLLLPGENDQKSGVLLVKDAQRSETNDEALRLCVEIATSAITNIPEQTNEPSGKTVWHLPRGIEWKVRTLGTLNRRLLGRARFIDRALRAIDDGLIIADIGGRVAFANPVAAEILGVPHRELIGGDLFKLLMDFESQKPIAEGKPEHLAREILMRSLVGRIPVERQISGGNPRRYYMLRMSAVTDGDNETGPVLGLVAALSDITQQHELERMKTDVMTLVSHELLTPLTAIQGMSEVLAQFDVPVERRREMHQTINDEAKRLAHMISEYLDITNLESGRHALRLAPLRIVTLIQRGLLLLEPLAAQRNIRIVRELASDLPVTMADADLIAQALTNLIANAIKYSPINTQITITAHANKDALLVGVNDQGYGIPADVLPHIFEKFYRVPRLEDADVPGTGLGLTLVREIVELHGGHVKVKSQLGVGSTFWMSLPLSAREG